jgi:hypothetical protein
VLIVPPLRLVYFSLRCRQCESYARLRGDVQYSFCQCVGRCADLRLRRKALQQNRIYAVFVNWKWARLRKVKGHYRRLSLLPLPMYCWA